jgi:hypothetical protein
MSDRAYSLDGFAAATGSTFEMETETDGPVVPVVLDRVEPGPAVPGIEQYAAYFRGPADPVYGQRAFRLAHPVLGTMELFLVPTGRVGDHIEYEACFNYPAGGG